MWLGLSIILGALGALPVAGSAAGVAVDGPSTSAASPHLNVTGLSPAAISLRWDPSTDTLFTYYQVDESAAGPTGPWTSVATVLSASANTFFWSGLSPGTTYWWQVQYYDTVGLAATTNVAAQPQPPAATLTASPGAPGSATLSWTNSASYSGNVAFDSYILWRSNGSSAFSSMATFSSESTRSIVIGNLSGGTNVRFFVRTVDVCSGAANCGSTTATSRTNSNTVLVSTPKGLNGHASASPAGLVVGETGNFSCAASGGQPPYSYVWAFGDGASSTSAQTTHAYSGAGRFLASCTVTDAAHATVQSSTSVLVSTAPGGGGGGPGNGAPPVSTPKPNYLLVGGGLAVVGVAVIALIVVFARPRPRRPAPSPSPAPDPIAPPGASGQGIVPAEPIASFGASSAPPPAPPSAAGRSPRVGRTAADFDELMDRLERASTQEP